MDPLVSVNMCTIRPTPRWRLMLDSLEKQTFKDFEYIIVDGLYDKRRAEVEKILKDYSFPITYVKDKPWYHSEEEQVGKRPGLSSARNTGVIYARGELMAWHDDNTFFPEDWLSRHVKVFNGGFDGMAGLAHGTHEMFEDKCRSCTKPNLKNMEISDLKLIKDYRGDYDGNKIVVGESVCNVLPVGWLYGSNMSIRTKFVLKINGFPEEFCGQMGSEDSFTTVCLQRAGAKLVLDKGSYVIHISDGHHIGFNTMFKFKNKEIMLMDGKMHFSNEKYVQDLLFKEQTRYRNNLQFDLSELREKKLQELYEN